MKDIMKTKINWETINWGAIFIALEVSVVLFLCGIEIHHITTIGWHASPLKLGTIWMIGGAIIFVPPILIGCKERSASLPLGLLMIWMSVGFLAIMGYTALAAWKLGYSTSAIILPAVMGGITSLAFFFGGGWVASR